MLFSDSVEDAGVVCGDRADGNFRIGVAGVVRLEVVRRGEESGKNASKETTGGMHTKSIECIVVTSVVFNLGAEVAPRTGQKSDEESSGLIDPATGGSDGDESSDGSREHSEH